MTERVGRILTFQPADPAENMALDEAILESVDRGGPATLRFYGWSEPTLSLGYFQRLSDRQWHAESGNLICVRRATGGGAIVHDHELTLSLATPVSSRQPGGREGLYRAIHGVIAEVLRRWGVDAVPFRLTDRGKRESGQNPAEPFLCFQRRTPEDLVVAGYKVLGSAQRKRRHAVLQHGSLLLRSSRAAPQLPGIRELAGVALTPHDLVSPIASLLTGALGIDRWSAGEVSAEERDRVEALCDQRYGNADWLTRR